MSFKRNKALLPFLPRRTILYSTTTPSHTIKCEIQPLCGRSQISLEFLTAHFPDFKTHPLYPAKKSSIDPTQLLKPLDAVYLPLHFNEPPSFVSSIFSSTTSISLSGADNDKTTDENANDAVKKGNVVKEVLIQEFIICGTLEKVILGQNFLRKIKDLGGKWEKGVGNEEGELEMFLQVGGERVRFLREGLEIVGR